MARFRRLAAVATAVALVVTLSSCVSIPSSGSASRGLAINQVTGGASLEVNPEGPEKGASQQKILEGFIAAFQSPTGGYAVARQFLTPAFAGKWDPQQSVQVRSGTARFVITGENAMDYSFSGIATVNSTGAYEESPQSSTLPFTFARVGKQWRISAAPNGIVLSAQTFQGLFTQHPLYFLDPLSQNLVPDLRWFPNGTAATRIVSALLAGPAPWLEGAVRTDFPDGTQLSEAGSLVSVDSGVAKVDLSKQASAASPKELQYMLLQLTDSLRTIPNISSVEISIDGAPQNIDDLGASGPQVDPKVDIQALVLRKKEFGFYANNKVAPLSQLSAKVVALKPSAATLSSDGKSVVVLGTGGVSIVREAGATLLDPRPSLIAPSLDEYGYVWSVPSGQPNAIEVFDPAGTAHAIAPSLPVDSQIVAFEVSRDGARVAILLSTATGPRLIVAAILRDQKQVPISLGPAIVDALLSGSGAIDVTWVDELTVATLIGSGAQPSVDEFTIGGQHSELGTLSVGAKSIVGGNGEEGLRVLGDDSVIYAYRGSSWQSTTKVDLIAVQR